LFAPQSNVGQMPQQHQSQDTHKPHWFPRQGHTALQQWTSRALLNADMCVPLPLADGVSVNVCKSVNPAFPVIRCDHTTLGSCFVTTDVQFGGCLFGVTAGGFIPLIMRTRSAETSSAVFGDSQFDPALCLVKKQSGAPLSRPCSPFLDTRGVDAIVLYN